MTIPLPPDPVYPPLSADRFSVRLLTIHHAPADHPIRCSLRSEFLDTEPSFEALSYTWGVEGTYDNIILNGIVTKVWTNLWQLLRQIRSQTRDRTVWVDALCIRQDDALEKSQQVQMIHLTFRAAERVVVWLGPAGSGSDVLFQQFRHNATNAAAYCEQWYGSEVAKYLWALLVDVILAYKSLMARPYWKRTWIIQEVYLARQLVVQCGDETITGAELALGRDSLRRVRRNVELGLERPGGSAPSAAFDAAERLNLNTHADMILGYMDATRDSLHSMRNIFDILDQNKESQCFDRRDKVYALQNMLLRPEDQTPNFPFVTVDYGVSREELLCRILRVWEDVLDLFRVDMARKALDLTWKQIAEYAQTRTTSEPSSAFKICVWTALQVTTVWHSNDYTDHCVFEVRWGDNCIEYVSRQRVNPAQEVLLLHGLGVGDRAAATLVKAEDGRWSLHGAVAGRDFAPKTRTVLGPFELQVLQYDFLGRQFAYPSIQGGFHWETTLTMGQICHLGLMGPWSQPESDGCTASSAPKKDLELAITWESEGASPLTSPYPVLTFDDQETYQLRLSEPASSACVTENSRRLQSLGSFDSGAQ